MNLRSFSVNTINTVGRKLVGRRKILPLIGLINVEDSKMELNGAYTIVRTGTLLKFI